MDELKDLKNYLRIDFDYDDDLLHLIKEQANLYLDGSITNWNRIKENDEYNTKVKILEYAVIQCLYDNRGLSETDLSKNTIINSLILQLDLLGATL